MNYTEKMVQLLRGLNGNKFWILNGKLHRENGPAIEGIQMDIKDGT